MTYEPLTKIYYKDRAAYEAVYEARKEEGITLPVMIGEHEAFFTESAEILHDIIAISRMSGEISKIARELPETAVQQYMFRCLIDEVLLNNEIEGVYSTRKEINSLIAGLEARTIGGSKRFVGMVEKYLLISRGEKIRLDTPQDVRHLYDESFRYEIAAEDSQDLPDGQIFRAGPVDVIDGTQRVLHHGVMPEEAIIDMMEQALLILQDDSIDILIRIAVFHYLFGYIHPFYEGNGRMSRLISSYLLAGALHPLAGLRLSYEVRNDLSKYYKAFRTCNDPKNKGDLTPFIAVFISIIRSACEQLLDDLVWRQDALQRAEEQTAPLAANAKMKELYGYLAEAALFSETGISTQDLLRLTGVTRATLKKRLLEVERRGLLATARFGHENYYSLVMEEME